MALNRKDLVRFGVAALAVACLLEGCTKREINTQNVDLLMSQFQDGTLQLDPSASTAGNTIQYAEDYKRLANRHQWAQLSKLLIQANSAEDYSWFLLGLSAEGLGYNKAARQYFLNAINSPAKKCQPGQFYQPLICGGLKLPDDAIDELRRLPRG